MSLVGCVVALLSVADGIVPHVLASSITALLCYAILVRSAYDTTNDRPFYPALLFIGLHGHELWALLHTHTLSYMPGQFYFFWFISSLMFLVYRGCCADDNC
jgi:hypothetical protein